MKYNIKDSNMFGVNMRAVKTAAEKLAKEAEMVSAFYKLTEIPEFSEGAFISDLYTSGGIELVSRYVKFVENGEHSYEVLRKIQDWYDHLSYDPSDPHGLY